MTIDDVVRLFEGDERVQPVRERQGVSIRHRDGARPGACVFVALIREDAGDLWWVQAKIECGHEGVTYGIVEDNVRVKDPADLAARLLVAAEVVETLRTSGVVDGQRVGGA